MSQTLQRKKSDEHSRLTHNLQPNKSSTKQSIKSAKIIPVKESLSSTSKLNVNSPRPSKSILTSKTSIDSTKKINNITIKSSKSSTGRIKSNYSEKRGLSTIYVPQSFSSKLNVKLLDKSPSSTSKDKEQIKAHTSTSEATESKLKSRERKLSRTLSPSEIKMLHFAKNRSDSLQKMDQNKEEQADYEYDYEDDFEVK